MSVNQNGSDNGMSIWDQLHQQTLQQVGAKLSPLTAKRVWEEGAVFINRKAEAKAKIDALSKTLIEQTRTRPHELELKLIAIELERATSVKPSTTSSEKEQAKWGKAIKAVDDLLQRYAQISKDWHHYPIRESELPLKKRDAVRLLNEAGWQGDVSAFLSQASQNLTIKSCQSTSGRGWYVGKLYDLGIRIGKLQPKTSRNRFLLENAFWNT